MEIPKEKLLEMYRNLLTARMLDDKLYELYSTGAAGMVTPHRGTGEEAIPIAVCANLRKDDFLEPNFRTSFCLFAKGLSLMDCIATECKRDIAKVGGYSYEISPDYGLLGHSGSLGENVCIYTGAAVSAKLRKTNQVCVCIFGDGAANRGAVHEGMVVAAAWKLPIVFMIQNNQYAMGTPVRDTYKIDDLSDRAKAYGFPGQTVDGNDVIATYEVVKEYVDRARSGGGPGLIVAETYRLRAHYEGAPDAVLVCVREGKVLDQAADMVRRGGIVVVTGIVAPSEVNPLLWLVKNLRFASHLGGPCTTSLRLIAHKQVNVKPLISEIVLLEEAQRAFDSMYSGENIVVLLEP